MQVGDGTNFKLGGGGGGSAGGAAVSQEEEEYRENLSNIVMCPECRENPPNLIEEFSNGDLVCASCGLVVGDRIIDSRSEWRTFANDDHGGDDPNRVGQAANPLLDGDQLETTIAFGEGGRSRELHRAQKKIDNDQMSKNLLAAYSTIKHVAEGMGAMGPTIESAKQIYKWCEEDKSFIRSKNQEVLIAGCIFHGARLAGQPRTFKEIQSATKVSKKDIGRIYKLLQVVVKKHQDKQRAAGILPGDPSAAYGSNGSTAAQDLCVRYCASIWGGKQIKIENLSVALTKKANAIKDLAGRSPLSVAAACVYFASHYLGQPQTSKDIAAIAGVSDGTIKTAYKFLYNEREKIIDDEYKVKGGLDRLPTN